MMVEEVLGPIVVSYEKTGGDRKEWDYGGGPKGKNKERQTRKKTVHNKRNRLESSITKLQKL